MANTLDRTEPNAARCPRGTLLSGALAPEQIPDAEASGRPAPRRSLTNRIVGPSAAWQILSASRASFLCRFTTAFTHAGGQPDLVAEPGELARPMVSAGASLQAGIPAEPADRSKARRGECSGQRMGMIQGLGTERQAALK